MRHNIEGKGMKEQKNREININPVLTAVRK